MKQILLHEDNYIGEWVFRQMGGDWTPNRGTTVGLIDSATGEILAGIVYENWNDSNCFVHLAVADKQKWFCREFLKMGFQYPFVQLGCRRITGVVESANKAARRLNEHLGMEVEAILINAGNPEHLVVYRMFRDDCRWLTEGEKNGLV